MKIATSVWTGVALLAMAQAAEAAPLVSGKYALMSFTQCEARFTTTMGSYATPSGGTLPAVRSVNPFDEGELNISVGLITFPLAAASSGDAKLVMDIVSGGSLRINASGNAMEEHREPPTGVINGTYSFTNTTFTYTPAGEPAMTWKFRAGDGVRTLYMVRRENARCVNAVTATKQ